MILGYFTKGYYKSNRVSLLYTVLWFVSKRLYPDPIKRLRLRTPVHKEMFLIEKDRSNTVFTYLYLLTELLETPYKQDFRHGSEIRRQNQQQSRSQLM